MRRLLKDILVVLLIVGVPIYFWETYSGPFQWLAEAQFALLGSYFSTITFVLTCLLWTFVCGAFAWIANRIRGRDFRLSAFFRSKDQLARRYLPAALAAFPVLLLAYAGYMEYAFRTTPQLATHVNILDLTAGKPRPSRFIAIDGAEIDSDNGQSLEEFSRGNKTRTYYVPVIIPGYQPGNPVHAFIEVTDAKIETLKGDTAALLTGLTSMQPLPGMIELGFERSGRPPALGYLLVRSGIDPSDLHGKALSAVIAALIITGIGVLAIVREYLRTKRGLRTEMRPAGMTKCGDDEALP